MPKEWSLRAATAEDYPHYQRLFPELGVDDPIPSRERWEIELMPRTRILEASGQPIAYVLWAKLETMGHVLHVVVDPAWRRHGAGAALMEATAEELLREGCSRWCLNVKVDNTAAIRLYERFGFSVAYASTALTLGWDRVADLPQEALEVEAGPIDEAEDAALEGAFQKPAGRLRQLRERLGMVLVRLVDPAHPEEKKLGIAAFDPQFPGAALFAAARPTLASPLLSALRSHARPGDTKLQLLIEGDPALVASLRAAGALVRLEIVHMVGEIPLG